MSHERGLSPEAAYPIEKRMADMERFIANAANTGKLERTQGFRVAQTYGVTLADVRAAKAKHRKELSSEGAGK